MTGASRLKRRNDFRGIDAKIILKYKEIGRESEDWIHVAYDSNQ
jgi:hypothetical protein